MDPPPHWPITGSANVLYGMTFYHTQISHPSATIMTMLPAMSLICLKDPKLFIISLIPGASCCYVFELFFLCLQVYVTHKTGKAFSMQNLFLYRPVCVIVCPILVYWVIHCEGYLQIIVGCLCIFHSSYLYPTWNTAWSMHHLHYLHINYVFRHQDPMFNVSSHYLAAMIMLACELHYSSSFIWGGRAGTLQNCKLQISNCLHLFFICFKAN